MAGNHDIITAVELGTSAIKVAMGSPLEDGRMVISAFQEIPSMNRIIKGEVTNVPAVLDLLSDALNKAEAQSGERAGPVYLAVTGGHISAVNVRGSVPINVSDHVIREEHVVEATRHARSYKLPMDREAIHSLQRTYLIDNLRRTNRPMGMIGNELTADIHLIHGNQNRMQTLCRLLADALGFPAEDVAFSGIADIYGVALSDEMHASGFLLIDIGAGVTEYVLVHDNGCMCSGQLTVGCDHLANDLAIGLHLPIGKAQDLLKKQGCARRRSDGEMHTVNVETAIGRPDRTFRLSTIETIIELRLRELFTIIKDELKDADDLIGGGIILCGGGAMIPEIVELATSVFDRPAMIGRPGKVSGVENEINSPRCVTTIGLLHLGYHLQQVDKNVSLPLKALVRRDFLKFVELCRRAVRI